MLSVKTNSLRPAEGCTFFACMEELIMHLKSEGRERTAETYRAALGSLRRFRGGRDLAPADLTPALVGEYQDWLCSRGLVPNTVSFYMRVLRAAYNRLADCGIVALPHPFGRAYTGIARTAKRALTLVDLCRLRALDLSSRPRLEFARDMFMLSFYLRGMSFVDMAHLRPGDLHHGHIVYRRRKTGRLVMVEWTPEMQQIVRRYQPLARPEYLLPLIADGANARRSYLSALCGINRCLKTIGVMAGLRQPLTLYVARHSWASAARAKGVPLGVISEGMGHSSEATTRIYLADMELPAVNRANAMIITSVAYS